MTRNIIVTLLFAMACAGTTPAYAIPQIIHYDVTAAVASKCFISSPQTTNISSTATMSTFTVPSTTSWNWTVQCNGGASTLTIKATSFHPTPLVAPSGSATNALNYLVQVANWTSTSPVNIVTTADPKIATTTQYSGSLDLTSAGLKTIVISIPTTTAGYTKGGGSSLVAGTYNATIIASLAAKP